MVKEENNKLSTLIFTDTYSYSISVILPSEGHKKGYLGCIVSRRKPRVGEDWIRGNDLTDGYYSKETFRRILADIVSFELLDIKASY